MNNDAASQFTDYLQIYEPPIKTKLSAANTKDAENKELSRESKYLASVRTQAISGRHRRLSVPAS